MIFSFLTRSSEVSCMESFLGREFAGSAIHGPEASFVGEDEGGGGGGGGNGVSSRSVVVVVADNADPT